MKTLHILNGDATLAIFKQTTFEGDILVWREILSEGPVSKTNLWATRAKWIGSNFGETEANYANKVLDEVEKLKGVKAYDEVVLWFEYDLVCQINLIYILSVLKDMETQDLPIYLICPDRFEGIANFRGLGELNASQLTQLYSSINKLNTSDLNIASRAWNSYTENNPSIIQTLLQEDFGNLHLLKKALLAHLLRFPNPDTKLNYIEETLLSIIHKGITKRTDIYESFWLKEPIFGITDFQIDFMLSQLEANGFIENGMLH